MNALLVLLALNLVLLLWLALRLHGLRRETRLLRLQCEALSAPSELPEDLQRLAREGQTVLAIRILNPMELANQRHWLAGVAGRLTPEVVRRIVAREAVKVVQLELPKHGVVAEVRAVDGA